MNTFPATSVNHGLELILSKRQLLRIHTTCKERIISSLYEIRRRDEELYQQQRHIQNTDGINLEDMLFRVSFLHNILNTISSSRSRT